MRRGVFAEGLTTLKIKDYAPYGWAWWLSCREAVNFKEEGVLLIDLYATKRNADGSAERPHRTMPNAIVDGPFATKAAALEPLPLLCLEHCRLIGEVVCRDCVKGNYLYENGFRADVMYQRYIVVNRRREPDDRGFPKTYLEFAPHPAWRPGDVVKACLDTLTMTGVPAQRETIQI